MKSDIDATIATLRQLQEKAQKGGANRGLQSIAAGSAIQAIESLTAENTRLRERLREEIMESYNSLTATRKSRYHNPEAYADAVLASEGFPPAPEDK